jgi:hypothetical protein
MFISARGSFELKVIKPLEGLGNSKNKITSSVMETASLPIVTVPHPTSLRNSAVEILYCVVYVRATKFL